MSKLFDCKRLTVQGGKRLNQPRFVFSGVFNSCMKQLQVAKGTNWFSSADSLLKHQYIAYKKDKTLDFENFILIKNTTAELFHTTIYLI